MGKKVNLISAGLVFAVFASLLVVRGADAFCVYNNTDKELHVSEDVNGGSFWRAFEQNIAPGGKACCNWKEKSCNKGGKRESIVRFTVRANWAYGTENVTLCQSFPIKAGGSLVVAGSDKPGVGFKCTAYFDP